MGFFNDLKEDLAAAVNELTESTAEKELADSEEKLREELAGFDEEKKSKKKKKNSKKNASLEQEIQNILNGIDDSELGEYSGDSLTEEMLDSMEEEDYFEGVPENETAEQSEAIEEDQAVEETVESEVSFSEFYNTDEENDSFDDSNFDENISEEVTDESEILDERSDEIISSFEENSETDSSDFANEEIKIVIETPPVTVSIDELQNINSNVQNTKIITKGSNKKMEDQITVITNGTSIKGDIISDGGIEIYGSVTGSIDAQGKIVVSGEISGDSKGSEIFVDGARIHGNIDSEGTVKIANESIIIGNIKAACAVIAGAVKGNIDVNGPVVLDSTAKVLGDIDCKLVQINNGAVIEGKCSQSYAEVSPSSFFENL